MMRLIFRCDFRFILRDSLFLILQPNFLVFIEIFNDYIIFRYFHLCVGNCKLIIKSIAKKDFVSFITFQYKQNTHITFLHQLKQLYSISALIYLSILVLSNVVHLHSYKDTIPKVPSANSPNCHVSS